MTVKAKPTDSNEERALNGSAVSSPSHQAPVTAYETGLGSMFVGDAEDLLSDRQFAKLKGQVQLILTSPPFPLNRKKRYGNLSGEDYLSWLERLAPLFASYLAPNGSIVMEIGNVWEPGRPTMSTLPLRALLAFQEGAGLHLCQEFVCYNPARLPSPAQWVTVERIRVKDAFTRAWWMSPNERPKASNTKILKEYSASMRKLLEKGTYNAGVRPSEHHIGEASFLKNNGGAIPPNVLVPSPQDDLEFAANLMPLANTSSNDAYQDYCRKNGITPHPARMQERLAEFFVRFLTDEGDLIMDPFAGSNTSGAVAERLNRNWVSIEINEDYARDSQVRFQ